MNLRIPMAVATSAALALGLGYWSRQHFDAGQGTPEFQAATLLPAPRPLPDFTLTDAGGRPFGKDRLRQGWSLLFFGFTHCPDICPNTLAQLHAVNLQLAQNGDPPTLSVVFVSVDPGRDTPAKLGEYLRYFDGSFAGVTGSPEELGKLTAALYVPYSYVPTGEDDYTVDHSGALVLVNPQAEAVAYFSPPHDVAILVSELRILLGT